VLGVSICHEFKLILELLRQCVIFFFIVFLTLQCYRRCFRNSTCLANGSLFLTETPVWMSRCFQLVWRTCDY